MTESFFSFIPRPCVFAARPQRRKTTVSVDCERCKVFILSSTIIQRGETGEMETDNLLSFVLLFSIKRATSQHTSSCLSHAILNQRMRYLSYATWCPKANTKVLLSKLNQTQCRTAVSFWESPQNRPFQSLRCEVLFPYNTLPHSVGGYCFWTCLFVCFCAHMCNKFKISTETWKDTLGNWQNAEFGLREVHVVSVLVTFYWRKKNKKHYIVLICATSVTHFRRNWVTFMWRNAFQDLRSQGSRRCCRSLTLSSASLFSHYHLWSGLDVFPLPPFMLHWGLYLCTAFIFSSIWLLS